MKTLVVDVEELYEQHAFATRQPLDGKCITCATCAAAQTVSEDWFETRV